MAGWAKAGRSHWRAWTGAQGVEVEIEVGEVQSEIEVSRFCYDSSSLKLFAPRGAYHDAAVFGLMECNVSDCTALDLPWRGRSKVFLVSIDDDAGCCR